MRSTSFFLCLSVLLVLSAAESFAGDKEKTEVPIEIAGRVILVKVKINDEGPLTFIVDTGATETVLTPRAAQKVGVLRSRIPTALNRKMVKSISVGNTEVRNLMVFLMDPPQALSLRLDKGIDYHGILGYTFLSRYLFTIDYKNKKLVLQPLSGVRRQKAYRKPDKNGNHTVAFQVKDRLVYSEGEVNGRGPVKWLVDTGAAETLLTPVAAKALKIKPGKLPGHDNVGLATLDNVSLGSATVKKVPTIVHVIPQDKGKVIHYHGIIGYPFLSRFAVTFNYRDLVITLKPN